MKYSAAILSYSGSHAQETKDIRGAERNKELNKQKQHIYNWHKACTHLDPIDLEIAHHFLRLPTAAAVGVDSADAANSALKVAR